MRIERCPSSPELKEFERIVREKERVDKRAIGTDGDAPTDRRASY